jgi:dTDP-4-dehydrorhamnose 3,5-epimerase
MPEIRESNLIAGVKFVRLESFSDERGQFLETFRREWFPERAWGHVQGNRSDSRKGVLRGLHFHRRQIDYWVPFAGRMRVGLFDLRRESPTFRSGETLEIGEDNPVGVYVPEGVAHGFLALTDAILTYVVDNYFDGTDEYGVAWDDPDIAMPWGTDSPILSPRDRKNPRLRDIPDDALPR